MTDLAKLIFRAQCSSGHSAQQVFEHGALELLLAAGGVRFHCGKCDARWEPTVEERVRLRAIAKRARLHVVLDTNISFRVKVADRSKAS